MKRWFQEFRRELSNKAFETVELLQEALTRTITLYWEDSACEGSPVSPGGRKQLMHCDINNPDRHKLADRE